LEKACAVSRFTDIGRLGDLAKLFTP